MTRKFRLFALGVLYLVIVRGDQRQRLFSVRPTGSRVPGERSGGVFRA
jgi:hypothetical protein